MVPLSSREETSATGHPLNHSHDTETSDKDLQLHDGYSKLNRNMYSSYETCTSAQEETSATGHPHNHTRDTETSKKDLQLHDGYSKLNRNMHSSYETCSSLQDKKSSNQMECI